MSSSANVVHDVTPAEEKVPYGTPDGTSESEDPSAAHVSRTLSKGEREQEAEDVEADAAEGRALAMKEAALLDFPDGGWRAWSVVAGVSLFSLI